MRKKYVEFTWKYELSSDSISNPWKCIEDNIVCIYYTSSDEVKKQDA